VYPSAWVCHGDAATVPEDPVLVTLHDPRPLLKSCNKTVDDDGGRVAVSSWLPPLQMVADDGVTVGAAIGATIDTVVETLVVQVLLYAVKV
jgi:hypothetical protein